jgi:hypothetical protein
MEAVMTTINTSDLLEAYGQMLKGAYLIAATCSGGSPVELFTQDHKILRITDTDTPPEDQQ